MKIVIAVLMCILLVMTLLVPAGTVIAGAFGYTFTVFNISVYAIIIAVLSACLLILCIVNKEPVNDFSVCLAFILPPLSLINTTFCVLHYPSAAVAAGTIISAVLCGIVAGMIIKSSALRIVLIVLSTLLVGMVGAACFFSLVFGNFGAKTVVKTVESPSGKYYAELIDDDQGALGGATRVWVYEKGGINCAIFKMVKSPQEVYCGKWGEFEDMEIHWKDDDYLVINSKEYELDNTN